MLSVLIPTYNYNVYPLVKEIHKQLSKQGIEFEIRIYEDGSTIQGEVLDRLKELPGVIYNKFKENKGRTFIRHLLAEDAVYENLLFLDADMFPKDRFFASKLLKEIEKNTSDVYFGGVNLPPVPPSPNKILRWKYGKEREAVPVEERKKRPYKSLISGAILIKKEKFLPVSEELKKYNRYGMDIYFSYLLKKNNIKVHHYNNPIMHLGLEDNRVFIKKTEQAVETLHFLILNQLIPADYSRLGKTYIKVKKWKVCGLLKGFFSIARSLCLKNLYSTNPSLAIFDLYKLCYLCKINSI